MLILLKMIGLAITLSQVGQARLFVPDISTTEYVNGAGQRIDISFLSVANVGQRKAL